MHKNNLVTLILLGLLVASAIYLGIWSKNLKKERKILETNKEKLEIEKKQLAIDTADLARKRNALDLEVKKRNKIISEIDPNHREISKYKNILSAEDVALQFEKEGFQAIIDDKFDIALDKFSQAEKTSPSFHMCYEISRLLRSQQSNFNNPKTQDYIKIQIIKKYSWKAPPALLSELNEQMAP